MILAQIHTLCESSVLFRVSSKQSADFFFYKIMPFFRIFEKKSGISGNLRIFFYKIMPFLRIFEKKSGISGNLKFPILFRVPFFFDFKIFLLALIFNKYLTHSFTYPRSACSFLSSCSIVVQVSMFTSSSYSPKCLECPFT